MRDLAEKAEEAVALARRAGADAAEAFVVDSPEQTVSLEPPRAGGEPALRTAVTVPRRGLGLTARWGDRVGFASTTDLTEAGLAEAVAATRAAGVPEDPLPPLTPPGRGGPDSQVPGLVDPRLVEMDLPELCDLAREVAAEAVAAGAGVLEVVGVASCRRVAVANSLGLVRSSLDTRVGVAVYAASPGGGLAGLSRAARSLEGLRALQVGRKAAAWAQASDDPRDPVPGRQTVVLRPSAVLSLLATSLGPALGADLAHAGASAFAASGADRPGLGDQVASSVLSVTDDATRPGGVGSHAFDAEGTPGQVTPVIQQGRLVSFLRNNQAAAWTGAPSTGNASRSRADRMTTFLEPSGEHARRAGVKPSTLVVTAPGASYPTLEAAGVRRGLLVQDVLGAFVIDPALGDFSVTTANAWVVERGTPAYPVKRAMLSGNVYALLKQVVVLAEEPEEVVGPFSLYSPSWVVADLDVV